MKDIKILVLALLFVFASSLHAATDSIVSESKAEIRLMIFQGEEEGACDGLASDMEGAYEVWKGRKLDIEGAHIAIKQKASNHLLTCPMKREVFIRSGNVTKVEEGSFFVAFKSDPTMLKASPLPAFSTVETGKLYTLSTIKPQAGLKKLIGISGDGGLQVEVTDDPNYQEEEPSEENATESKGSED